MRIGRASVRPLSYKTPHQGNNAIKCFFDAIIPPGISPRKRKLAMANKKLAYANRDFLWKLNSQCFPPQVPASLAGTGGPKGRREWPFTRATPSQSASLPAPPRGEPRSGTPSACGSSPSGGAKRSGRQFPPAGEPCLSLYSVCINLPIVKIMFAKGASCWYTCKERVSLLLHRDYKEEYA